MTISEHTREMHTFHLTRTPFDLERELTSALNEMTADTKRTILYLLENSISNEKRVQQRKHQKIRTRVVHGNQRGDGVIENLSPGGAFLSAHRFLPPGSEITLSFQILNFEFPVMMSAEVIWIDPRGMGLKFKPSLKLACRLAAQKLADALNDVVPET